MGNGIENAIIIAVILIIVVLGLLRAKKHFSGGGCCETGSKTIRTHQEAYRARHRHKNFDRRGHDLRKLPGEGRECDKPL